MVLKPKVTWDDKEIVVNVAEEIKSNRKVEAWGLVISIWCLLGMLIGIILAIFEVYLLRLTDETKYNQVKKKWTTIAKNKNMSIRFVNFPDSIKHLQSEEDRKLDPTAKKGFESVNSSTTVNEPVVTQPEIITQPITHQEAQLATQTKTEGPLKAEKEPMNVFTILGIVGIVFGAVSVLFFSWFGPVPFVITMLLIVTLVGLILSIIGLIKGNKIIGIIAVVLCALGSLIQIIKLILFYLAL